MFAGYTFVSGVSKCVSVFMVTTKMTTLNFNDYYVEVASYFFGTAINHSLSVI